MSKEPTDSASPTPDEGTGLIRFAGPDARSFLQGQLSNDVNRLEQSRLLHAALSTPQGRVVAIVRLVAEGDAVLALLPRSMVKATIDRLRKYVLRAKVTLLDVSDEVDIVALVGDAITRLHPHAAAHEGNVVKVAGATLVELPGPVRRALLYGPPEQLSALMKQHDLAAASSNQWRLAQIAAGEPQVHPETTEQFVAQMLNLDVLDGISFTKGCYTGQEIIARAHHRGRVKRRMLRWRARGALSLKRGDSTTVGGRNARIVEIAQRDDGTWEFLAVVTGESTEVPTPPHGGEGDSQVPQFEPLPLPYTVPFT